jgi:PKD repeat protein
MINHTQWLSRTPPQTQHAGYSTYHVPFTLSNGSSASGILSYYNKSGGDRYVIMEFTTPLSVSGASKFFSMSYIENDLGGGIRPTWVSMATAGDTALFPSDNPPYNGGWGFTGDMWASRSTSPVSMACSFTATPLSGVTPLSVAFSDTSSHSPTSWSWHIRNNATISGEVFSNMHAFSQFLNGAGTWDVNMTASGPLGTCTKFMPNYITVTNTSTNAIEITLRFVDSLTANLIQDVGVGIYDYNHTEWYNVTAGMGILPVLYTGTLLQYPLTQGTVFLVDADADGYLGTTANVTALYNGYVATIALVPGASVPGASNATIKFEVVSNANAQALENVRVSLFNESHLYSQTHYTNAAGIATFQDLLVSTYQYSTYKDGYQSATAYETTTGGQIKTVSISLVPVGATPTPTPFIGGPTPAAGATPDTRTNSEKDQAMMDLIRNNAEGLILVAIVMTMMYMIGYKP